MPKEPPGPLWDGETRVVKREHVIRPAGGMMKGIIGWDRGVIHVERVAYVMPTLPLGGLGGKQGLAFAVPGREVPKWQVHH